MIYRDLKTSIPLTILGISLTLFSVAQNPIIQTNYTADPAPMVHNGTVYLYTTHDEDITVNNFFTMNNWMCYSSTDMVNWTDHGVILSYTDFTWSRGDAWAGQCIHRNGKFYFFVPVNQKNGGTAIGVAVSDSPTGPFKDALNTPFLTGNGYIDPTVFIDDDGQAYLYWGNPDLFYVKLNEDMVSYDKTVGVVKVPLTVEGFGPRTNTDRATSYEEGPWLYKRSNRYYLLYPGGPVPEHLAYSTSTSPTGPWSYGGKIMNTIANKGAFTNHPGLIDYKGKSYLFYHNAALAGGGGYKRSVCIDELKFNENGSIPLITPSTGIQTAAENLNPYQWNQAETIAWEEGIETTKTENGIYAANIDNNDYIKVRSVDFGTDGASAIMVSVACDTRAGVSKGGKIEIRLDNTTGTLVGSVPVSYTGGADVWMEEWANITGATGIHDVYFVFKGESTGNLFLFDKWKFVKKTASNQLLAINTSVDSYKIDTIQGKKTATIQTFALYADGTKKEITSGLGFEFDAEKVVILSGNTITGVGYGEVTVHVSYNGFSDKLKLIVKNLDSELSVKKLDASQLQFELLPGATAPIEFTATFADGHTELVTSKVTISNPSANIATISNGLVTAKAKGTTTIKASYKGKLGEAQTVSIEVNVVNRSPFVRNEAEDFSEQSGIQTEDCTDTDGGKNIGFVENGDWIRINALDFDKGAINFTARAASGSGGGKIELRTDSRAGKLVGTCTINGTGGWQSWLTKTCDVSDLSGVHDLYLLFTGGTGYLFNLNWWTFKAKTSSAKWSEKQAIIIETRHNEKYLNGLYPTDLVTLYTISGQKIKTTKATSESIKLEGAKGLVIVEINRGRKKQVLKTVL
jgi:hypothetical protein